MTSRTNLGLPYTLLVPVHEGGSDPSTGVNPTLVRQAMVRQNTTVGGRLGTGLLQEGGPGGSFTITVDNASFPSGDEIWLGDLPLIEGKHWSGTDGDANDTADSIADAITALYGHLGWSATGSLGDHCTVNPPADPQVRKIRLNCRVNPANISVSSDVSYPDDLYFGPPSVVS